MGAIEVGKVIDAPVDAVWDELRHIDRHVTWMADAERIDFHGDQRSGVGTSFSCLTRIGPVRLTDEMTITDWEDGRVMGVEHTGAVTGRGRFTLTAVADGDGDRTEVRWAETLTYPWWLGARVGGVVGDRVLAAIWRGNLDRLAHQVTEAGSAANRR